MKRLCLIALAGLVATQARAVGRIADVTILDRDTGERLTAHYHNSEYWVAGRPGARYAINIRNQQAQRLLAVTSVDGINVLSGDTAAFDQRGYVFDPWTGYDIAGWRKSDSQIAAFTFTSIPRSYAARTGRPQNVGVIGVALFREHVEPVIGQQWESLADASPAALAQKSESANDSLSETVVTGAMRSRAATSPSLGTGHGQREQSWVTQVAFERDQSKPNEIIRIRYDSYDNLLAMGVLKRPAPAHPRPRAFPDEPKQLGYVPDP